MAWQYYISGGGVTRNSKKPTGTALHLRCAGAVSTASWIIDSQPRTRRLALRTAVTVSRADGPETEILFRGTITNDQPSADPSDESTPYQASDAWWDMDGEIYRQSRKITLSDGTTGNALYGRSLLGRAADGERMSAAQIISAAIDYAAGIGINIQKGAIDAPVTPPWIETTDKTLSEIIRLALLAARRRPWIGHPSPPTLRHAPLGNGANGLDFAGLGQCASAPSPSNRSAAARSPTSGQQVRPHGRRRLRRRHLRPALRAPRSARNSRPAPPPQTGDQDRPAWRLPGSDGGSAYSWLPNDADITR